MFVTKSLILQISEYSDPNKRRNTFRAMESVLSLLL
jgi:hypothetical protein